MKMLIGLCGLILVLLSSGTAQPQKHPVDSSPQGEDCTQIKKLKPESSSGVYMIQPAASGVPFKVYCEMRPDGGWTVIQKRTGPAVSFERNLPSYETGFGHLTWDHWLGLEKIYRVTRFKRNILRVDLWDHERETAYAQYGKFNLGSSRTAYQLHVGRYTGNAGDAIRGNYPGADQNGFGFSTIDGNSDDCYYCIPFGGIASSECADHPIGGWWFSDCGSAHLNGPLDINYSGIKWDTWSGYHSIRATRMMIKSE